MFSKTKKGYTISYTLFLVYLHHFQFKDTMKISFLSKISWLLFAFGIILALGGQFIRLSIIYDLYIPGTLELKSWYNWQIQHQTIRLYANGFIYCGIGFVLATIAVVMISITSASFMKKKGWMFMSVILWLLAIGFSAKSLYSDYTLANYLRDTTASTSQAISMVTTSLQKESVYFLVSMLCQISIVCVIVFKPLDSKKVLINETSSTL